MARVNSKLSGVYLGWPRTFLVMAVACSVFGLTACGKDLVAAEKPVATHYVGTWSCSSVSCHGRAEPRQLPGTKARNEFATWMDTDQHARANNTIWSDKFQEILSRLGAARGNSWDLEMYSRCARCHDPLNETPSTGDSLPEPNLVPVALIQPRGIGCESCHGPAGDWLAKHYERDVRREQLAALGMNATPNLLVRSQVCASCHVGSAENDMNHDMIAAGHPALRFEMASYHDRLAKHWPTAERLAIPDFQAQLWAAGQLATADAALRLLGGRAARAARIEQEQESESGVSRHPWPEFSEYSCLGCHRRLRTTDDSRLVRLSKGQLPSAGQPAWNPWFAVFPWEPGRAVTRDRPASFPSAWQKIGDPMQRLSRVNANEILELTKTARTDLNAQLSLLGNSPAQTARASFSHRGLTAAIRLAAPRAENWEAVCQLFLALQAADRGYKDTLSQYVSRGVMDQRRQQALLAAVAPWHSDLEAMRWSLSFGNDTDWPRAMFLPNRAPDSQAHSLPSSQFRQMRLEEIRQMAVRLAEQIDARLAQLDTLVID